MKRRYCILLILVLMTVVPAAAFANNLLVENISLVDQDTTNNTYDIQFDLAWDNCWFITGAPSATANWDAAWVFAKYSTYSGGSWSDWAALHAFKILPARMETVCLPRLQVTKEMLLIPIGLA